MQMRLHVDLARAHLARGLHSDRVVARHHLEQAVEGATALGMRRLASRARDLLDGAGPAA
jgi:hypothetical protein